MPKISVIVPVYNTEQYLPRCINSILVQTFTDFELLLIDDGSKDGSGKICDEYSAKDSRIRVFHKENGGVSSARNHGLNNAQGEWITFVDSDDWIEENCLESCIAVIQKFPSVDIIRYGYCKEVGKNRVKNTCIQNQLIFSPKEMIKQCHKYSFWGFIWNTVYKKRLLGNLRFNEDLSWLEDHIFTYKYINLCQSMYLLEKSLYHYSVLDSGLSCIKDAYIVKRAAEEEFEAISAIIGVKDAINGYYNKLKEAINILYKYEDNYCRRKIFYKRFTISPLAIGHRNQIIDLYKNKYIPYFLKDWVLKARIKQL